MESKNLVSMVLALTVGIICVGSILVPVLSDAMTTEDTFTNDGYYYMQKISASDDTVITAEYTKSPLSFTYNGETIDTSELLGNKQYTFATAGTNWVLRFTSNTYVGFQGIGSSFNFGNNNVVSTTVTIQSGTITAVVDSGTTATYTQTYDELWVYSPEPTDYVMKKMDGTAYMKSDSEFYAVGSTQITNWNDLIKVTGTIDDYEATVIYPVNVSSTVTDAESVYTAVNNYVGLYALEKLTFTIGDGTNTADAVYSYFIVPAEVTAERAVHFDAAQIAMLAVIPIIMLVAILMIAVRAVNRD